jgi:hypothetical protein
LIDSEAEILICRAQRWPMRGTDTKQATMLSLMDQPSFVPSVFTKNRKRLIDHDVASRFFGAVVDQARTAGLMSDEHFQERNVTPHVAKNEAPHRSSAIDGRTTRHAGYAVSQVIRKRVAEIFGWIKTVANFRKARFKGLERTQSASYLVGAAYSPQDLFYTAGDGASLLGLLSP